VNLNAGQLIFTYFILYYLLVLLSWLVVGVITWLPEWRRNQ